MGKLGKRIRTRRRLEYIVAVQCAAWLAAVTVLLWLGPEWWDAVVASWLTSKLGGESSQRGCEGAPSGRLKVFLIDALYIAYIAASWSRLGVLGTSWSVLGPLEPLGASCGIMWASWERLGGILRRRLIFRSKSRSKWVKFRYAILECLFAIGFDGFR